MGQGISILFLPYLNSNNLKTRLKYFYLEGRIPRFYLNQIYFFNQVQDLKTQLNIIDFKCDGELKFKLKSFQQIILVSRWLKKMLLFEFLAKKLVWHTGRNPLRHMYSFRAVFAMLFGSTQTEVYRIFDEVLSIFDRKNTAHTAEGVDERG